MASDWEQVKKLFRECLELAPTERGSFLDEACAGDGDLLEEVKTLLAAAEDAESRMGPVVRTGSTANAVDSVSDTRVFNGSLNSSGEMRVCRRCHRSFTTGELVCPHDGDVLVVDPDLLVDTTIDGLYQVMKYLGGGGFGHVYLARHVLLRDLVAIKVLPYALSTDPERLERFLREGRAARSLRHANLVMVHDLRASADGLTYMVMEYVDGRTLREECARRGKLAPKDVIELLGPVASALDEAHAHGIVHRDIKPENIMFGASGGKPVVKLLDLGIAKLREILAEPLGDGANVTRPGHIIGTPHYMSPEQWGDVPDDGGPEIDARADVYSLGVVIYEMVSGRPPFHGRSSSEIRRAHLTVTPPLLHITEPSVPEAFSHAIAHALAKSRSSRPESTGALLEELRHAVAGELAEADTLIDKVVPLKKRWSRASIAAARIAAAIAVAAIAVGAAWWLWPAGSRPEPQRKPSVADTRKVTFTGNVVAAAISPDGTQVVAAIDERGKQSLYLCQTEGGGQLPITPPTDATLSSVAFTHDGNFVYYCSTKKAGRTSLYRLSVHGGTPQPILPAVDSGVAISPGDDRIAFIRQDANAENVELAIANADGAGVESVVKTNAPQTLEAETPAWSPDGLKIACAMTDSSNGYKAGIAEVTLANKSLRLMTPLAWWQVDSVSWSPDGLGLVVSAATTPLGDLELWRVTYPDGGAERIQAGIDSYGGLTVANDGRIAAVQTVTQQALWVSHVDDVSGARRITEGNDRFMGVSWTPDGRILCSSRRSGNYEAYVMDENGSQMTQLTFDPVVDRDPVMSPDRRTVFFVSNRSGRFNVWKVSTDELGAPVQVTSGSDEEYPAASPDGNWLVYQGKVPERTAATIWKMPFAGGEPVSISGQYANWPAVSPDGKWIAWTQQTGDDDHVKGMAIPFDGVGAPQSFEVPVLSTPRFNYQRIRWSSDSREVLYINNDIDGISQIWSMALGTGNRKPLTSFPSERIFTFDAHDGALVMVRGSVVTDVVVLTPFSSNSPR